MKKPGRPTFAPTDEMRATVDQCVAVGMPLEDVARAIGCTAPTLRKHFRFEIETARARKRAEVVGMIYALAKDGKVPALKLLEAMTRDGAVSATPADKLGKKEAAALAATQVGGAGSDWGDDLNVTSAAIN